MPTYSIAQCLMPAFRFGVHDPREAEKLVKAGVSGFCLYGGSIAEVSKLTARLQEKSPLRLLFASDFENGAGSQLKDMTELPSNMAIGASGDIENARIKGSITARQAKALGVNWIFAPVVDLSVRPDNPIVNIRAFGEDPGQVTAMARAFIEGIQSEGVGACLKHFPGHGDTSVDSHLDLANIESNWETLRDRDLHPYYLLANEAGGIMTGHLVLKEKDKRPASLSEYWIKTVLRKDIGFRGLVVTDALMMGAIQKRYGQEEAIYLALKAGSDILLYPEDPWAAIKSLEKLYAEGHISEGIEYSKKRIHVTRGQLYAWNGRPTAVAKIQAMEKKNFQAAMALARQGLAWVNRVDGFEPVKKGAIGYEEYGNRKPAAPIMRLMHDKAHTVSLPDLLKKAGYQPQKQIKDGSSVIAIFHKPKAFSGEIGLPSSELQSIKKKLKQGGKHLVISFGDPYLLKQIPSGVPSLSTFSDCMASQLAAIELLVGGKPVPERNFGNN